MKTSQGKERIRKTERMRIKKTGKRRFLHLLALIMRIYSRMFDTEFFPPITHQRA